MNHKFLIDNMTWSYSRIKTFTDCPYKFLLKYIYNTGGERKFFSDYGSFMHKILEKFHNKELQKEELVSHYLMNFDAEVQGKAPSSSVFSNYFRQGIQYLKNLSETDEEIVGVEKKVSFKIGDYDFVGYIDFVTRDKDGNVTIVDNKSHNLVPRTGKTKPTKTDRELDDYLVQLYLYSTGIKDELGFPTKLSFNCFREGITITEPFIKERHAEAEKWAVDTIKKIAAETDWKPNPDFFYCKHICDVSRECEYYDGGGRR